MAVISVKFNTADVPGVGDYASMCGSFLKDASPARIDDKLLIVEDARVRQSAPDILDLRVNDRNVLEAYLRKIVTSGVKFQILPPS